MPEGQKFEGKMYRLSGNLFATASKWQALGVGIVSLAAGMALLVPTAWMIAHTFSSGRLSLAVIFITGLFLALVTLFLAVAFALFRGKKQPEGQLMGSAALYVVGSFLFGLPLTLLVWGLWMGSKDNLSSIVTILSMSAFGLLVIRLAWMRGTKHS